MATRRTDEISLPGTGTTIHDEFLRSLTRERYGGRLPKRENHRNVNGPTAQWNLHLAAVEADDLWHKEDEEE